MDGEKEGNHQPAPLVIAPDPVVSIVIPVYGKRDLTRQCLASIAAARRSTTAEVIVIDDASPDSSWDFLEDLDGIVALRNEDNLGYLRSVNHAASTARGEFLMLLNNDTVVADDCIDELVRTIRRSDDVGAVGAKLLFPDGRLQEAGSFVWGDGNGHNFGHGQVDGLGDAQFTRDVDYCSAAALLIRTDLWRQIGGFDERYAPAYYEDTDLCMEIRRRGFRVLYQPRAVVHHVAGASHGAGPGSLSANYQERNRLRFAEKWRRELREQYPSRHVPYALPRRDQSHVMVFDEHVPVDDRDSGALRMWRLVNGLVAAGRRVTFVPTSRHPAEPSTSLLRYRGIDVEDGTRTINEAIAARAGELDVIVASRPHVAAAVFAAARRVDPAIPLVYDMVDQHGLRHERAFEVTGIAPSRHEKKMAARELEAIGVADHVIAITEDEAAWVRRHRADASVSVVGNIHESSVSAPGFSERSGLLFVGSWAHPPNVDALTWLVDEVMPAIWAELPGMRLHLAGSGLPQTFGRDAALIENHGWVPDLGPLFERVLLSIAPLRYGAGMKGKVGDSLARGVPVVGTPVAAEGFDFDAVGFGGAGDVASLVEGVVALSGDEALWNETRARGIKLTQDRLSISNAVDSLERIFEQVAAK